MLKKAQRLLSPKGLVLLLTGIVSWSLVMVRSGNNGFWGANGHDGIWHIALARSLARGSWQMPTFAGERLQNYHLGFDLLLALVNKLTSIPVDHLYFQIFPPILATLIGVLVYRFVLGWTKSHRGALWSLFFTYFGGSLGWVVTFFREGKLGGESMFWSQQAISTLVNPPFALSLVVLLLGLIVLQKYFSVRKKVWLLLAALVFGCLIQIKSYAGLLALTGLLLAGVFELIKGKRLDLLAISVISILVSIFLLLPLGKAPMGLIIFKPFWFLETMMGLTDRLGWLKFGEAMVNYRASGDLIKAVPAYVVAFLIFWYGNLGTRMLGEIFVAKSVVERKMDWIRVFAFGVILAGVVVPMLFLQAGTPWNTIQFFYYSLFFLGILAGVYLGEQTKGFLYYCSSALVLLLTLPTTVATLKNDYLTARPPARIGQEELQALRFLEGQSEGVVLTYNFDRAKANAAISNPPRPLYFYESTAYVSAYTNKPVFLEDEVNLDITQYDWRSRRELVDRFVNSTDPVFTGKFLAGNNIKYLYLVKDLSPLPGEHLKLGKSQLNLTTLFENDRVIIFEAR